MRTISLLLLLALSLPMFSAHAEIYRWVDAQGRVMYGDDPPAKSRAKQVDLPMLTVADSFVPQKQEQAQPVQEQDAAYSDFKITSPEAGETVRANGGNLTVTIGLQPKLKEGDGITLYLDSRQVASGSSLSFALTEVERGEHTAFAVLNDAAGNIIMNTETVKFNVLQHADSADKTDADEDNNDNSSAYQNAQDKLQGNMYGREPKSPADTKFSWPSLPQQ